MNAGHRRRSREARRPHGWCRSPEMSDGDESIGRTAGLGQQRAVRRPCIRIVLHGAGHPPVELVQTVAQFLDRLVRAPSADHSMPASANRV
jgi:hypothetical protein